MIYDDLRKYSQYKQGQVETWFLKTGGINKERFGIHVDLARRDRLRAAVDRWVKSVETTPLKKGNSVPDLSGGLGGEGP